MFSMQDTLDHKKIKKYMQGITKIKPFINKYNWEWNKLFINKDYWKKIGKNNLTNLFFLFVRKEKYVEPIFQTILQLSYFDSVI